MEWVLVAAAAAAVAAVLAIGHYAFWTWRLRQPIADDGVVLAVTRDGWRLALGTRHPRATERHPPVLLVHGLSANRWTLDAGTEEVSLAAHLAREGFRTFSLDLRGHGDSRRGPAGAGPWTFDDYVESDVPAALDAIRRETGEDRVLWVVHSLGAVAGMVSCQLHQERIADIVAIAGPMSFDVEGGVARHVRQGTLVDGRYNRTVARMVAPWAGLLHPAAGEIAINGRNVERPVLRRLLANGIEDVPPGVFAQLAGWVTRDVCRSADDLRDYRAGLASCRQPALFLAAPRDALAPPDVVRRSFEAWGGPRTYVEFREDLGHAADYGHTDLIVGRAAPAEIFPVVSAWLASVSTPPVEER
ncbi:MAG: alpha/beta hydrolase [Anaeromyxobacteraceae bacterium]